MRECTDPVPLDTCGCCKVEIASPEHPNDPGQPALAYRAGTHGAFLAHMKARIYQWTVPDGDFAGRRPLSALTTRATDDPSIALMDAWAVVGDVLTFYQERIANEGFLRTATERRSILEMARAIGYELHPGVAAETYLTFTVDESEGVPTEAEVPAGTQIMSIPAGAGELPQTFETSDDFTAYRAWNTMRPRTKHPQELASTMTHAYLEGTATNLAEGDVVLLVLSGTPHIKRILKLEEDTRARRTRIDFAATTTPLSTTLPAHLDGQLDLSQDQLDLTRDNVESFVFEKNWEETDLQAFLALHEWDADDVIAYVDDLRDETFENTSRKLLALREKVSFFGHNTPRWDSLPANQRYGEWIQVNDNKAKKDVFVDPVYPSSRNWDSSSGWEIWKDPATGSYYAGTEDVYLARKVRELVENTWAVFIATSGTKRAYQITGVTDASATGFGISAETNGLVLAKENGGALSDNTTDKPAAFTIRRSTAFVRSESMSLAAIPITSDVAAGTTGLVFDRMVLGLEVGQTVALTGTEVGTDDQERSELLVLDEVTHSGGYTTVVFADGLQYAYQRDTVTINANVVAASHGEMVAREVLGSGSGPVPFQRFTLKKPPLTHTGSSDPSGAESTLTVRVDGVRWDQKKSLYGLTPEDPAYVVRIDDDANPTVQFGDGKSGARLPTGRENVVASYRTGIGTKGEVDAGSLSLLKTRPYGVRSVTNPLAASGADDPEKMADARTNAPLTVLTLDRIVSLQDYEDFARAYAGIGKAKATVVWDGEAEVVHLTVADANGDEVVAPLYRRLLDAIEDARDPLREVVLESFQPFVFFVTAEVLIDERYEFEDVKADVEEALEEAFSFEERAFAQPVTAAEVLHMMHGVEGVVAVDLNELYRTTPGGTASGNLFRTVLPAEPARFDKIQKKILPAQLLTIHAFGINLTEMTK